MNECIVASVWWHHIVDTEGLAQRHVMIIGQHLWTQWSSLRNALEKPSKQGVVERMV